MLRWLWAIAMTGDLVPPALAYNTDLSFNARQPCCVHLPGELIIQRHISGSKLLIIQINPQFRKPLIDLIIGPKTQMAYFVGMA